MARHLETDSQIDDFIDKVVAEAVHHGGAVAAVITPLSTAVRARLNLATDKVEVYERNGNLARTCWVTLNRKRYVFTYNYKNRKIDLRANSLRGTVLFSFNNSSALVTIEQEISQL